MSEQTKHTPGPWHAEMARNKVGDSFAGYWLVTGPNRAGVADCFGEVRGEQDENGDDKHLPDEEIRANAELCAGAPDMLAILKEIEWSASVDVSIGQVRACPCCYGWMPPGKDWKKPERFGHRPDCKLQSIIARAESRQPVEA
jgi:hypothetical protein